MELELHSDLIYKNNLDTDKFARILNDPSQCYKFYWLEAIVNLITITEEDLTFDQIINEMIWEAWHSVTRYHLKLGPTIKGKSENFLEHAIGIVEKDSLLKQPASKNDVMEAIVRNDSELRVDKNSLTIYVPYRLLSSFLDEVSGSDRVWDSQKRLIAYFEMINKKTPLLYTIIDGKGLQKKVHVNEYWKQLIYDNYPVITSWIQLKKIRFLQDRNPGVPGIIYKLSPENETTRKLSNARDLWKSAVNYGNLSVYDIYSGRELDIQHFDLDHFVPWSYVANDELWNLIPMEKSLNSSKNNKLPDWGEYFRRMAESQYRLYEVIFSHGEVRTRFEKCRRDNLNAIWATERLYIEGNSREQFINILEHNMKPLYDSAYLQGYRLWKLPEQLVI